MNKRIIILPPTQFWEEQLIHAISKLVFGSSLIIWAIVFLLRG